MGSTESGKVSIGEDIYIVNEEGCIRVGKQPKGTAYGTTGIKQQRTLVGDQHLNTKIVTDDILHNLFGKMMDVDNNLIRSGIAQSYNSMLEHGTARHRDKRLGHCIGIGFESGSQPGSYNQSIHFLACYNRIIKNGFSTFLKTFLNCNGTR